MNYYDHHLGDYDGATAHLSWPEDLAYRRLICLYYRTEAPIPADVKQACRLVRAVSKAERDAVQQVLSEFFELEDGGWHNARCDRDIAAFHEMVPEMEAKRENAKERQRRARERRSELFEALRGHNIVPPYDTTTKVLESMLSRVTGAQPTTAPVTPVTRDNTATHLPPPISQMGENPPPPRKRGSVHDFPPGFEAFWAAYPRKTAKDNAAKAFAKLRPDDRLLAAMLAALELQKAWPQWTKDRGEFIPHPATWLNGRRWEDFDPTATGGSDPFAGAL